MPLPPSERDRETGSRSAPAARQFPPLQVKRPHSLRRQSVQTPISAHRERQPRDQDRRTLSEGAIWIGSERPPSQVGRSALVVQIGCGSGPVTVLLTRS